MPASFVLKRNRVGKFSFQLVNNGRVLATSESYGNKASAVRAVNAVKKAAAAAEMDDQVPTAKKAAQVKAASKKAPTQKATTKEASATEPTTRKRAAKRV